MMLGTATAAILSMLSFIKNMRLKNAMNNEVDIKMRYEI